eukprot:GEMP01042180.1.p1 GENE.GEMP01042180.1~~GEMP01042180.1.p1  ORF type:complete len:185 (+),score=43.34 GEMP01042180.1:386-940(+)
MFTLGHWIKNVMVGKYKTNLWFWDTKPNVWYKCHLEMPNNCNFSGDPEVALGAPSVSRCVKPPLVCERMQEKQVAYHYGDSSAPKQTTGISKKKRDVDNADQTIPDQTCWGGRKCDGPTDVCLSLPYEGVEGTKMSRAHMDPATALDKKERKSECVNFGRRGEQPMASGRDDYKDAGKGLVFFM